MYQRPQWPGYASGVTVGFGYDLGYHTKADVQRDWEGVANPSELLAMMQVVGVTGNRAQSLASQIKSQVHLDWNESQKVFERITLPEWSAKTAKAYRIARDDLHPDCNGALVGNTFNRGEAISSEGRSREKYLIREALRRENYSVIPGLFREQRKYWPGTSGSNGLQTRRSEEADLFQKGLDAMKPNLNWPPDSFLVDDRPTGDQRTYLRNDNAGENHPIWYWGELHPRLLERKDRILGIGREGQHCHRIRVGTLYAASAAAYKAEQLGYHLYVTSGNRWGVSTSPNHGQNGDIGDAIDFVVTKKPEGQGDTISGDQKGMQETYDVLSAAVACGANGIGWGRSNGAGHHVEVDDAQRDGPSADDVWPYCDDSTPTFLRFEKDYSAGKIQTDPVYQDYRDYYYRKGQARPDNFVPRKQTQPAKPSAPETDPKERDAP